MKTLTILRGLPGSGKTTHALKWVAAAEHTGNRARSNRDDLRASVYGTSGVLPFEQEQTITAIQQSTVRALLAAGKDVIVDDTNLRAKYARQWADLAAETGAGFDVDDTFLATPLDVCIARDAARDRTVGEAVIRRLWAQFRPDRGLPTITATVKPDVVGDGYLYVPDPSLPSAVMVDIDGTVAIASHRSPYDPSLYHTDTVNEPIAELVWDLHDTGAHIIFCSGRDDTYAAETLRWLDDNNLWWWGESELHMRPVSREPDSGRKRNDAVVKVELFREHIAPRYNVKFAVDDRNRVVSAYRAIGLTVLQVADGDF